MSEVKVNKISPRTNCGTVTLGDSGDSFTIPSGVTITNNGTQTGFGREGSVNWQTGSIKTAATFTAVSGEGYFVDTSSNQVTANLPAGSAGAIVAFSDYARNFNSNNLVVTPNGSEKIGGVAASMFLNVNGQASTLVYVDSTKGWINVQNAEDTEIGVTPTFIAATGGTVTTVYTNFKVHTFTGPGTFCVSAVGNAAGSESVDYLVVAGGGSGGTANGGGGGGAAGGLRYSASTYCNPSPSGGAAGSAKVVTATAFPITVGGGGAAISGPGSSPSQSQGNDGSNSIFSTFTSTGGGGGGGSTCGPNETGRPGGSGGGGGSRGNPGGNAGGTGNSPSVSPSQGNNGGTGGIAAPGVNLNTGGGGGGHSAVGGNAASGPTGGSGGNGSLVKINGSCTSYAGGGGGNAEARPAPAQGQGGTGGGGAAGEPSGTAGTTNTGGGGGGTDSFYPGGSSSFSSGAGGSGIVIIRYKFQ